MIDQMFRQEIKNAEIVKQRCWWFTCRRPKLVSSKNYKKDRIGVLRKVFCCEREHLLDPEKINPFLDSLIDPFKDKEETVCNSKNHLESLWFEANQEEWVDGGDFGRGSTTHNFIV